MSAVWDEFYRNHPVFLLTGVVVFLLSAWSMQRLIAVFSPYRLTIPAVFYLTYLLMIFFPAFAVFVDRPGPYRESFLTAVISVLVMIPLGIYHANKMFGFSRKETSRYFTAPMVEVYPINRMFHAHVLFVSVSVGIFVYYLSVVPVLPIVQLIKNPGETLVLTLAREESFKLLDPRWAEQSSTQMFYAFLFLRTMLFPVLILTTLGYYVYTKERRWLALFLVTGIVGSFYAISSLSRAPMSAIVMRVFFFLFLFFRARLSTPAIVIAALSMSAFPIIVTTFAYSSDRTVLDGVIAVGVRLTYTPAEDLYYYFEVFPGVHDYLYGHSLVKPILKFLGQEYFYIENYVALYISPKGVQSAHANAAFVSNLHADFGFPGVVIGSFLVGFSIQVLQIHLARQEKTMFNVAVFSFIMYAIWVLNFGSVTSVLIVNGVLPVFVLVWLMKCVVVVLSPTKVHVHRGRNIRTRRVAAG